MVLEQYKYLSDITLELLFLSNDQILEYTN